MSRSWGSHCSVSAKEPSLVSAGDRTSKSISVLASSPCLVPPVRRGLELACIALAFNYEGLEHNVPELTFSVLVKDSFAGDTELVA